MVSETHGVLQVVWVVRAVRLIRVAKRWLASRTLSGELHMISETQTRTIRETMAYESYNWWIAYH